MTKRKTGIKKSLSIVMMLIMLMSAFTFFSVPSSAQTSGSVNSSAYCTVRISSKLLNKRGKQYAKVKVNTSSLFGRKTSAKIRITLRDNRGRYITSWVTQSGTTIKLGDDHPVYRIYVESYDAPAKGFWGFITSADNFLNAGAAANWSVTSPKDCTIQ